MSLRLGMQKLKILNVGKLVQSCCFSARREGESPVAWGWLARQSLPHL